MKFPTLEFKISWILLIKWMCLKKHFVVFKLTYCHALENLSFYSQFLGLPSACGRVKLLRTEITPVSFFFFPHLSSLVSELFFDKVFDEIFWRFFWRIIGRIFLTNFWRIFLTNFLTNLFDEIFDEFFLTNFLTYNLLIIASFRIGVPSILFFHIFMNHN